MDRSRRSILRASGLAAASLLAGCSSETAANDSTETSDANRESPTTTPGASPSATATAAGDTTSSPAHRSETLSSASVDGSTEGGTETPTQTSARTPTQTSARTPTQTSTPSPTPTPDPPEPRLYDGFERGALADAYVGDRGEYEVTDDGILGEHGIRVLDSYAPLTHGDASTPRGCEYRGAVRVEGAPNLRVNVQNAETPRDPGCYSAQLHAGRDVARLYRVTAGDDELLGTIDHDIDGGDVLVPRLRVGRETIELALESADGDVVGRTDPVEDATFDGGTFGFHTYGSAGSVWDDVRRVPL